LRRYHPLVVGGPIWITPHLRELRCAAAPWLAARRPLRFDFDSLVVATAGCRTAGVLSRAVRCALPVSSARIGQPTALAPAMSASRGLLCASPRATTPSHACPQFPTQPQAINWSSGTSGSALCDGSFRRTNVGCVPLFTVSLTHSTPDTRRGIRLGVARDEGFDLLGGRPGGALTGTHWHWRTQLDPVLWRTSRPGVAVAPNQETSQPAISRPLASLLCFCSIGTCRELRTWH
jgi:hypothetical protein